VPDLDFELRTGLSNSAIFCEEVEALANIYADYRRFTVFDGIWLAEAIFDEDRTRCYATDTIPTLSLLFYRTSDYCFKPYACTCIYLLV